MIVTTDQYNAILAHAKANYEKDGWDFFVETCDINDLQELAHGCSTMDELLESVRKTVRVWYEYEQEVRGNPY